MILKIKSNIKYFDWQKEANDYAAKTGKKVYFSASIGVWYVI